MEHSRSETEALRSSLRKTQVLLGILALCTLVTTTRLLRERLVYADSPPAVITAKQFVVVDDSGNQTVVIGPISGQTDRHYPNSQPVDYRGVAIYSPSHVLVTSLGLATPTYKPGGGITTMSYSELFLQSKDNKTAQSYLRATDADTAPNAFTGMSELFLQTVPNSPSINVLGVDIAAAFDGASANFQTGGRVGFQTMNSRTTLSTRFGGPTGLVNCPTSEHENCGPIH